MSRIARSLLFVPGDRADRFEKAAACGAHQIIVDLEDAVSPERKSYARDCVRRWLATGVEAAVRINGGGTSWFDDDIAMLRSLPGTALMLPKADLASAEQLGSSLPGHPFIALIETVRGYVELRQLAAVPGVTRFAFGSVDFAVDSGIEDVGEAQTSVRTQIVLESAHAGLPPPIDGVSLELNDLAEIRRDVSRSRALGFGGKLCIHPRQVAAVNDVFLPTPEELDWARRVVAADESSGGGVTSLEGKMIDKPVVDRARRTIEESLPAAADHKCG